MSVDFTCPHKRTSYFEVFDMIDLAKLAASVANQNICAELREILR